MKKFLALAAPAVLAVASALPAMAQIDNGLDFTTSFPFYAGNVELPAGSYKVTQESLDSADLLIESTNGEHSAFVQYIPTQAGQPHQKSAVTFQKYGDVDYLDGMWVEGQYYGMELPPSKQEQRAAAASGATQSTHGN